jgi:hypothetical protein
MMRITRGRRSPAASAPALPVAEPPRPQLEGPQCELASRRTDGLDVALLWHPRADAVTVSVVDHRSGDEIHFAVPHDRALDAFHHPFAYAP